MKAVFEEVEAITVDVEDGTYIDPDEGEDPDPGQLSFQRFNLNEGGVVYPPERLR